MKPSFSRLGNKKTYKKEIGCPDGTVPILRNTKEFIINSQFSAENYFHPLSLDSPGTHVSAHFNYHEFL